MTAPPSSPPPPVSPPAAPPDPDAADRALADLLVAQGLLAPAELESALQEKAALPSARLIDILHGRGLLRKPGDPIPEAPLRHIEEREKFGRFRLLRVLGSGGMGTVYQARDEETGRVVALKVFAPTEEWRDYLKDLTPRSFYDELLREAEVVRRLNHPNIVRIYESGLAEGHAFISMEYVPGGTLDILRNRLWLDRDYAFETADRWMRPLLTHMRDISLAVDHAHGQGLLHRDIKPTNILATYEAAPDDPALPALLSLKISDFGLALDLAGGQVRDDRAFGTPAYASPEQSRGRGYRFIPASDVWSLGVVLYEMVTGVHPFARDTVEDTLAAVRREAPPPPSAHHPNVRESLDRVIMNCLQKEPSYRYLSAEELANALEDVVQDRPAESMAVEEPMTGSNWLRDLASRATPRGLTRWLSGRRELAEVYFRRGVSRSRRGDLGGALSDLSKTLEERPDHPGARFHRALALFALGGLDEALVDWDSLLAEDPGLVEAYVNRALALRRLGRFDEALRDLEEALRRAPAEWPHRGRVESSRTKVLAAQAAGQVTPVPTGFDSQPLLPADEEIDPQDDADEGP